MSLRELVYNLNKGYIQRTYAESYKLNASVRPDSRTEINPYHLILEIVYRVKLNTVILF